MVAETRETELDVLSQMEQAIRECVVDVVNIPPDVIRLVPPHSVLKTSSGKIRRAATSQLFQTGHLGARPVAVWWQIVRLGLATMRVRLKRRFRQLNELLYAGYAWGVFLLMALPVWLGVVLLPKRHWRWSMARTAVRLGAFLTGIRIERLGLEHLPADGGYILVANHASYLDALILTAALPNDYCYLVKRELIHNFVTRIGLQRLGSLFVERVDPKRATEDTEQLFKAAAAGKRLALFPEGGIVCSPGLRPFHMGAFLASAHSGLRIVPVALRGTRTLLRSDEWLSRPGQVQLVVGPGLVPTGSDWEAALELRNCSRAFILAECGEHDSAEG